MVNLREALVSDDY